MTTLFCSLFGDSDGPASKKERKESSVPPPQSPSAGWTKFKETNPDEFRTPPLKDQRARRQQGGHSIETLLA